MPEDAPNLPQAGFTTSGSIVQPKELGRLLARLDRNASSGLDTSGGQINLHYGPRELRGRQAMRIYSEMGDDTTVGVLLFLVQNITRNVRWFVREASTQQADLDNKNFVETCLDDMDQSFDEFISSALTMCQYGFSPHEIVYKKRLGKTPPKDPNGEDQAPSDYTDEKYGWAKFQLIGQETVYDWKFDAFNGVLGLTQQAYPMNRQVFIGAERLLNFRTSNLMDNPTGVSPLRRAYEPWRAKRNLERIEEVAIERDYCGVAVVHVSEEILMQASQPMTEYNKEEVLRARATIESLVTIVRDLKTNEQQGILMPMAVDSNGKDAYRLELLSSPGSRTINVAATIDRRKNEIWGTMLADFLGLGQGSQSQGSYAMHQDKSALFIMGMRTYLRIICETFNRVAIPRLFAINGISATGYPKLDHTPLEQVDVLQLAQSLQALSAAGMPIFPNAGIEARVYEILGLPAPVGEQEEAADDSLVVGDSEAQRPVEDVHQSDTVETDGSVTPGALERRPGPPLPQALNPDQKAAASAAQVQVRQRKLVF